MNKVKLLRKFRKGRSMSHGKKINTSVTIDALRFEKMNTFFGDRYPGYDFLNKSEQLDFCIFMLGNMLGAVDLDQIEAQLEQMETFF